MINPLIGGATAVMLVIACSVNDTIAGIPDGDADTLAVVPALDLVRYAGTWYEIARLPNRFQKSCAGDVTATYTLMDDGTVQVVNRCRNDKGEWVEAVGKARPTGEAPAKLEVRFAPAILSFLPFVWGKYWVIDLAPDYGYAVVGEPGREYLWILSRTPSMAEDTYAEVLGRLRARNYDVTRLVKTKHSEH